MNQLNGMAPKQGSFTFLEIKMVPVSQLFVDETYQRTFKKAHANKIREGFDCDAFGVLKIARRGNNRYAVVDGQHRLFAAKSLGFKEVPCEIIASSERKKEASVFSKSNGGVKKLSRLDLFRADLESEKEYAVEIYQTVRSKGFSIGNKTQPGVIGAVYGCMEAHKMGPSILGQVLEIISKIWIDRNLATHQAIILGLATFIKWLEEKKLSVDPKRLLIELSKVNPVDILTKISTLKKYFGSGSAHLGVAVVVGEIYNKRLRGNKLPVEMILGVANGNL